MGYDEELASRMRSLLERRQGLSEKRMFGGLGFMLHGNMAAAASSRGGLLLRCAPEDTEALIGEPGVERFEMRGKAMNGWLHVRSEVVGSEAALARWLDVGAFYATSLPPK